MPDCSVENCNREAHTRGLCSPHVHRLYRYGDPQAGGKFRPAKGVPWRYLQDNLMSVMSECKIWPYGRTGKYGIVHIEGKQVGVHVLACAAWNGPRPDGGWEAAHSCNNGLCFNGAHLSWKTPSGNAADRVLNGTNQYGTASPHAKLTEEEVIEARRRYAAGGVGVRPLAQEYGVSRTAMRNVVLGKQWKHVPSAGR